MFKKSLISLIFVVFASPLILAQKRDSLLVLPFENTSGKPEFNWVGESFALSLSELLRVPGLRVVSNSERKIVQQRLRIPLSSLPSLATSLKLARDSGATLLIGGSYDIIPAQGDVAATLVVKSRVIKVNEGRYLNEEFSDGSQKSREIVLSDALANLQTMQGQIAYQILYQRDRSALAYSQNDMIVAASKVPARAFEAYIKGLLTPAGEARENYFKNALRLFQETNTDGNFAEAALELAHLYLGQRRFPEAIESFERVINANAQCKERAKADSRMAQCNDESFAEASFYIGIIQWQQGNYEPALAVLRPLAEDLKLTSVYNTLGAIAVQAARAEKKNEGKSAALLKEGYDLLEKAADSAPEDVSVKFNFAVAAFLNNEPAEAITQLKSILATRPTDGEANYLLSKVLASQNDPIASTYDNAARQNLTAGNRYANLEKEWLRSKTINDIPLRVEQPQRKDFISVVLSRRSISPAAPATSESDGLIAQARTHFKNGADDEAMAVLRRILASEPMSAESYLILGKIHLRRGDLDQAISSFKTAIFWDNRQIDAHIALGKIYLEKGECLQAKTYTASALELDKDSPEAAALVRQTERCSK